jgi:hypothetical protein
MPTFVLVAGRNGTTIDPELIERSLERSNLTWQVLDYDRVERMAKQKIMTPDDCGISTLC